VKVNFPIRQAKRMNEIFDPIDSIDLFLANLGIKLKNKDLIRTALIHPSFAQEKSNLENNQRLEFLGDAILDFIIAEYLYLNYPQKDEGELTQIRAKVVCEKALAEMAINLNLGKFIFLGKGEEASGGRNRKSILADALEAIIGAIYLDAGFDTARRFVIDNIKDQIIKAADGDYQDFKSKLQELVQAHSRDNVYYKIIEETGPAHARTFVSGVYFRKKLLAQGVGNSKKEAEQKAAETVLNNQSLLDYIKLK